MADTEEVTENVREALRDVKERHGKHYIKSRQVPVEHNSKQVGHAMARLAEEGAVEQWSGSAGSATWRILL